MMNPRILSWLCLGSMILVLAAMVLVSPIRGQDAPGVSRLERQIDRVQDRQNEFADSLATIRMDMTSLHAQFDSMRTEWVSAKNLLERCLWGIFAILGSILYRTVAAFWALRAGWLLPKSEKS